MSLHHSKYNLRLHRELRYSTQPITQVLHTSTKQVDGVVDDEDLRCPKIRTIIITYIGGHNL